MRRGRCEQDRRRAGPSQTGSSPIPPWRRAAGGALGAALWWGTWCQDTSAGTSRSGDDVLGETAESVGLARRQRVANVAARTTQATALREHSQSGENLAPWHPLGCKRKEPSQTQASRGPAVHRPCRLGCQARLPKQSGLLELAAGDAGVSFRLDGPTRRLQHLPCAGCNARVVVDLLPASTVDLERSPNTILSNSDATPRATNCRSTNKSRTAR